ncbi:YLP motif-containing protein 1 isoform X2 [Thalassophryne amazonica]|uniref:YLP motif-containing protein 1 isoform X2 n=1 Tax=Thalassophryne amazonica TaxID=390379 RepID=UPI0014717024|nr:YLP motif-containing protein 1 isoform X2 [Thalassophryne amazonica]
MYPSWGNYGGSQSQNFGGTGPRKPLVAGHPPPTGYGGFEASNSGSMFSSLQEQHRQQMQQLQMLHQKQLQSVLHHSNAPSTYGGGPSSGPAGSSWYSEGYGQVDNSAGAQSYYRHDQPPVREPPVPQQDVAQPPPPPPPQPNEPQPGPPPPEPATLKPPDSLSGEKEMTMKESSVAEDKSMPLQEQQQLWYQQHLINLQKLRQEKAKQNQKEGDVLMPPLPHQSQPAPPPHEPPKNAPPPPPPKEEPPSPPPPPKEDQQQLWYKQHLLNLQKIKQEVTKPNQKEDEVLAPPLPPQSQLVPPPHETPKTAPPPPPPKEQPPAPPLPPKEDPEEAARLQQLQAAAAQWQQVQQQRAGMQYQALMQQHEKLQQILERYQQLIQQPADLQSMSAEMQLRHYEMQQQQFTPLFQDWERFFMLWYEQFQSYPHKDQLQDYELQWKQWKEQMSATNAHLHERVATLRTMMPYASTQYSGGMIGEYGQYTGHNVQFQQQSVSTNVQQSQSAVGLSAQGPYPPSALPVTGGNPAGVEARAPVPPTVQPPNFSSDGGPRGNLRFDQPQQRFDGPPRFDQPQHRFDGPPRFDQPRHHFDGPRGFDKPPPCFDGPPRFDQPQHRFNAPPRFDLPPPRFDGPQRFDQPQQRFDVPPRFGQTRHHFDGPPRFEPPQQHFECPSRFESPRAPQPQFGQQPPVHPITPNRFECLPVLEQNEQMDSQSDTEKQPVNIDSKIPVKPEGQPQTVTEKDKSKTNKMNADDMTVDSMLVNEGFFVPNDPIPQTLQTSTDPEDTRDKKESDNSDKSKVDSSEPSIKSPGSSQNTVTPNTDLTNTKPQLGSIPPEIQQEVQLPSTESKPEPATPLLGRGRGNPAVPLARGRGQRGRGDFRGPNTVPLGDSMDKMSHDYMPPDNDLSMHEDYQWQDPSYEEFGDEQPEVQNTQDMWIPEDHHFTTEEDYYEEPIVGSAMGRGGPPMGRGGPPMGRGGPPMGRGGPPMGRGGPPMGRGHPPMGRGGPPMGRGGPPMGRGRPPVWRGGPPSIRGVSQIEEEESMDRHWEEPETAEYLEEEDVYWEERRPPVRGMRPPFPPVRGRPPRGHPSFMHQGRGRPPPVHRPMDPESLDTDSIEMDPKRYPLFHGPDPHGRPMYPDVERGRHLVPPHDMRDPIGEPLYDEEMERELGLHDPHGRRPPLLPHDIMDREGIRRPPRGRGMARGIRHPGPPREAYEERVIEGYVQDYGHGEDGYGWRPPRDYPPDEYEDPYYPPNWDGEHVPPEKDYYSHMPLPERLRDEHWREERERGYPYPYEEDDRERGELRIREYGHEPAYQREGSPAPYEWDRPPRLATPPGREYPPAYEVRRPHYDDYREEPPLDIAPDPLAPVTNTPEHTVDPAPQGTSGAGVLALSQRQHEIILKAAQELKLMREMQEGKTAESHPAPSEVLPELPAGLLGLEIPPEVRDALKIMSASGNTATGPLSWDPNSITSSSVPAEPTTPVIPRTVDYSHGQGPESGTTVERISYGERIVLRPDPVPDRGYEKELLGPRELYGRDPYYERRSDPYMDRREYSRERELYRDEPLHDYERERYERERYPPRDDSTQSMVEERPLRSGYRERDRDVRSVDRGASHDRDDHYGRPAGYDRPPYERVGLDHSGPERFGRGSSPFKDRRSYPEDRGSVTAPSLPPLPPPRVEKKPEIKNIDDLLKSPGRLSRPERIVIIMRGLPGSGKSHVAKLIRDKEVECGGAPPRVLVLDDYFMTEVEKTEKDPDTGKRVKKKVLEYEYEPEMEDTYRSSMLKTFKKTLDDGFFPFIILDTINDRVKHFEQFWSAAKTKGFEVYLAEITADSQTCTKRNVHGRSHKDIMKMSNNWESSPRHMVRLDVRSLLQDAAIEEVEMEDFNPDDEPTEPKREDEEESDLGYIPKSKWEMDTSEAKLDKLDGLSSSGKRKRESDREALEDYLQLPDDYATRMSEPGKKRVRWADLEEQKDADRKRAIGFVVGQTDWEKITDESGQLAQRALNRTKYF